MSCPGCKAGIPWVWDSGPDAVPFGIDVKRFGFGCVVESTCPECGEVVTLDYGKGRYLSYPAMNSPFDIWFCHYDEVKDEEHEWSHQAILRVRLESIPE